MDCAENLKSWFKRGHYSKYIPALVMPFNITDARRVGATGSRR